MQVKLIEIPGLDATLNPTVWRIRGLVVEQKSPVLQALQEYQKFSNKDWKAIIKVMRLVAQSSRVLNEKHVKKCANSSLKEIWEMRAHTLKARVMFFYDTDRKIAVCTNAYTKGQGDQTAAFTHASELRSLYEKHYHEK